MHGLIHALQPLSVRLIHAPQPLSARLIHALQRLSSRRGALHAPGKRTGLSNPCIAAYLSKLVVNIAGIGGAITQAGASFILRLENFCSLFGSLSSFEVCIGS